MIKKSTIAERLFGDKATLRFLMLATFIMLFTLLGSRDIWTQEHRWADIVAGMFYRHDFLHPFLGENNYYDKPLLSYWLIVITSKIMGGLSTWALRIPAALSGVLAVWSIVRLGEVLKNKSFGLLAGWMLLTSYYFIFWARTSSADMMNLAGSLFAVAWYFSKRDKANFFDFAIFFLIIALTSLCKGLVGAIVPAIVVLTDIVLQGSWRNYLKLPVFLALIPALLVYVAPFIVSSYYSTETFSQNGLYLVYRENIVRYFQPFDHQGPIYTYFIYLPIYMFPWIIFFIPAVFSISSRWTRMNVSSKWMIWSLLMLFLFFTLSGSRRSYYVLPMVPFAILVTADWVIAASNRVRRWSAITAVSAFILLFFAIDVIPAWYYSETGMSRFAGLVKNEAEKTHPWNEWHVVLLDAESKLNFYLQLPPNTRNYQIKGTERVLQTKDSLLSAWPILGNKPANTIFITRMRYLPLIKEQFPNYVVINIQSAFFHAKGDDAPVAFVPHG